MKPKFSSLLPFIVFLGIFALLNIVYSADGIIRDNFAICAAFIALISSFFTFRKKESWNKKVEIFIQGSSHSIVIHMCYIFLLSTVFTTILQATGGIDSAVSICLSIIPTWCILPGMFIVSSLFSFTVGTSMGAIAAFMPIAVNIATHLTLDPALMAATIVCGAMFGDNLSILSDTTIAAVKVTNTTMTKKLLLNSKIALPAFVASLFILAYKNYVMVPAIDIHYRAAVSLIDIIKTLPYVATFYLALTGIDIMIVLVLGIIFALGLGVFLQNITILAAINLLFDGFYNSKGMVNVFILVLLLSGLSSIITYNGGVDYIINKLRHKISSPGYAKLAMLLLVVFINITIAINTIAIIIAGPIAAEIGEDYAIDNAETACILDIGSCTIQGLLPYTPQLLLAASMAHVSTISLLPYLYYQFFLVISLLLTIIWRKNKPIRK